MEFLLYLLLKKKQPEEYSSCLLYKTFFSGPAVTIVGVIDGTYWEDDWYEISVLFTIPLISLI